MAGFAILGSTEPDFYRGNATGIPRNNVCFKTRENDLILSFQNVSVNVVMAQTFLPGVTHRNTGASRREIKFSIRRRDNHALGVTLGSIGDDVVAWL